MNKFSQRSSQSEFIDQPDIPFNEWSLCLRELNVINSRLGGHIITIRGVNSLIHPNKNEITIAEIGCGGGDNLKAIHHWSKNKKLNIRYIGIDLNEACIDFARLNCKELPKACFIHSDYRDIEFREEKPDMIFSSLFCHHFKDQQLTEMIGWLRANAQYGFFINDLQRNPIAYYSIKLLTKFFSRSYLVKNDAPISVLRGFHKNEWKQLLHKAGIENYKIRWQWAFRYLIIVKNE